MFKIKINGRAFVDFESAQVEKTLDENSGKFQFSSSNTNPADYPIRAGDLVEVTINGKKELTGYCERISASEDEGTRTVAVEGRDNTCDLIDSSLPDSVKNIPGPITMKAMIEKIVAALGADIGVIQTARDLEKVGQPAEEDFFFGPSEEQAADSGKTCMEFIVEFARKLQVYLIADGQGNINIFRPSRVVLPVKLINRKNNDENNILSYTATFDHSQRFGRYRATSQTDSAITFDYISEESSNSNADVVDSAIRQSRYLEFQTEESMTGSELNGRVNEESNLRRALATDYKCLVQGTSSDGVNNWELGSLVPVIDEFAGIQGVFLIRSLIFATDGSSNGTVTDIGFAPPEAYNVRGEELQIDKRRAKQAPNLQTTTPPVNRFRR